MRTGYPGQPLGGSSNGKTPASGAGYRGSSPCPPACPSVYAARAAGTSRSRSRQERHHCPPDVLAAGPHQRLAHERGRKRREAVLVADPVGQQGDGDEVDRLHERLGVERHRRLEHDRPRPLARPGRHVEPVAVEHLVAVVVEVGERARHVRLAQPEQASHHLVVLPVRPPPRRARAARRSCGRPRGRSPRARTAPRGAAPGRRRGTGCPAGYGPAGGAQPPVHPAVHGPHAPGHAVGVGPRAEADRAHHLGRPGQPLVGLVDRRRCAPAGRPPPAGARPASGARAARTAPGPARGGSRSIEVVEVAASSSSSGATRLSDRSEPARGP